MYKREVQVHRTILECRSTGKGAQTEACILSGSASIRIFDLSLTGNHWKEEITWEDDGSSNIIIFVTDISNSGKHNCYLLNPPDMTLPEAESILEVESISGIEILPCKLPARLHKKE